MGALATQALCYGQKQQETNLQRNPRKKIPEQVRDDNVSNHTPKRSVLKSMPNERRKNMLAYFYDRVQLRTLKASQRFSATPNLIPYH